MVVFSWAVVSFCIELFCVVTLQYQILVRIAIAYFIIEKKNAVNTKKKQFVKICFYELFVFLVSSANWNLYNYSSNFPYFTGFPACSLVK